jgi:hypothetical protein
LNIILGEEKKRAALALEISVQYRGEDVEGERTPSLSVF